jgi:hypothetical protein
MDKAVEHRFSKKLSRIGCCVWRFGDQYHGTRNENHDQAYRVGFQRALKVPPDSSLSRCSYILQNSEHLMGPARHAAELDILLCFAIVASENAWYFEKRIIIYDGETFSFFSKGLGQS